MPDSKRRADARRSFWIAVAVFVICLVAIVVYGWFMLRDSDMSLIAVIALAGGVLLTLVLGIGLMSLLFYSNREGYDDEVGRHGR